MSGKFPLQVASLFAGTASALLFGQAQPAPPVQGVAEPPKPPVHHLVPPLKEGDMPCDSKDQQPVIVGLTTREVILSHRAIFKTNMDKVPLPEDLKKRWQALSTPCVLVVAFGSWCGDSQRELPELLALMTEENPFVKVQLVGAYRDKKVAPGVWPKGLEEQPVAKVPTFWHYVLQPGGAYKLAGSIVENPPKKGQRMAEALVDLLEQAK